MPRRTTAHLLIPLDPAGGTTMQRQIYGGIRRAILERRVAPGTRLPSTRALAHDLGVSRTTSLLALEQLRAEGYVAMRGGSGTYVATDLPDESQRALGVRPVSTGLHPPLSARGTILADAPSAAVRIPGPPRPFRMGTPAVDLFPTRLWASLVHRRLRALGPTSLDYGAVRELREAIAGHVAVSRDTRCTPDQILVVGGAQIGLDLLARVLLDPGDIAWLEEPGYSGARGALTAAGARIVPVPVDAEGLDVEAGLRRARGARLAYVTPSHQFPLGVAMSLRRRLALLRMGGPRALVDRRGRLRQRVPLSPASDPVPARPRRGRARDLRRQLQQDALPVAAPRVPGACRPTSGSGWSWPAARSTSTRPASSRRCSPTSSAKAISIGTCGGCAAAYRERLEALREAAERYCGGMLRLRPVLTGLHAVGDLVGLSDVAVSTAAAARGLEVTPLSSSYRGAPEAPNGLVLGFGSIPPDGIGRGMRELALVLDRLRRAPDQARAVTR